MEAVDPDVEPPLFWLVENILENLGAFKMQAWIHQVGLHDITERLKSEVERAEPVIAAVEGRIAKPLARLLGRLKELLYDADDVVDELDYHRIRQQVETGMIASADEPQGIDVTGAAHPGDGSRDNSGIQSTKGDKRRAEVWKHYKVTLDDKSCPVTAVCTYCQSELKCKTENGTKVLRDHLSTQKCKTIRGQQLPNRSSSPDLETDITVSSKNKRKRTDESSTWHTPLDTVYWNKEKSSSNIEQIIRQLQVTLGAVSEALKLHGLHRLSSPGNRQPAASGPGPTAPFFEGKIYGRSAEKESLIKLMKKASLDVITVVPIVGIGGIGKSVLARFAYDCCDPDLKFDHRLWVSVSNSFDIVRLLRGMLDSLSQGKGEGIDDLPMLQKGLKNFMESKQLLLIFDDIWNSMDTSKWKNLMALLKYCKAKRIVLLVTTRSLAVAKLVGTDEPVILDSMKEEDFWLLFRECAFGDDRNKEHPILNAIGQEIVKNLNGNPLAAETAGMLLREHLTVDHWNNILKYGKWKSLELRGGIMSSLKRSYNFLSENLKQCFRYCCLFPKNHTFYFGGAPLIRCWISQGFVRSSHNGEEIEDIGKNYLNDLVKWGLLEQTKGTIYSEWIYMNNLMHDFAREISKSEIATIDGSDHADIGPTVRHISVVAVSPYHDFFIKKMKKVMPVKNLRSFLIIGFDCEHFLSDYHNILKEAKKLRLLQIWGAHAPFLYDVNCTHLRQLTVHGNLLARNWSLSLSMFYHMQVLDAQRISNFYGMNNLLSMRFLSVSVGHRSSGTTVAEMGDQQAVKCFEMTQVRSMNKLVHLQVLDLQNGNKDEAYAAKLRDKHVLETLYLSWTDTNNGQSSEHSTDTEGMLEGLEPHPNIKHLHINGYSGATYPSWLATSVTCLQMLLVKNSRSLQKLPSLARLSSLTTLELDDLPEVSNVSIPPLEVLQLTEMPKLKVCSCNSVKLLNSRLQVLFIRGCQALKDFPLFENSEKLKVKEESWMQSLSELGIIDCPHLIVPYALPPNAIVDFTMLQQPKLPTMMQSSRKLLVQVAKANVTLLDRNVLAFHRLSLLVELAVHGHKDITCVVFSSASELINLQRLYIHDCKEIWFSDVSQEDASEHMTGLTYLKHLGMFSCGIKGSHLFRMLQHLRILEELRFGSCHLTRLSLEENRSDSILIPEASSSRTPSSSIQDGLCIPSNVICTLKILCIEDSGDPMFYGSKDCLARFTSLKYLGIWDGPKLFSSLVHDTENNGKSIGKLFLSDSLVNLAIQVTCSSGIAMEGIPQCPDMLQLCFPQNQTHLQILKLMVSNLKYLQLNFCTALEELEIGECDVLSEIEGLQFLDNLRHMNVFDSPNLLPFLECHAMNISNLESIEIDSYYILTTSFCSHLTSLQCLKFVRVDVLLRLTAEHENALRLLTSLQELHFLSCNYLENLPDGLHYLPSLNKLEISSCPSISKLPVMGLPTWLEELEISHCSEELTQECRMLATITRQPKVTIDYICVN